MENAKKNVVAFEVPVKNIQRELQRMASSFDGTRIMREAKTATAAVESIGGVTKLTENETRKLNSTLQESLAKYKALGQDVPADLRKIADETSKAVKAADDLKDASKKSGDSMLSLGGVAKTVGGMVAGAFTVDKLISFSKEVLDMGGEITDMADRFHISTNAVQEFKHAAEDGGASLEDMTGAVEQMSNRLAEGGDTTVKAMRDLNLSVDTLRSMRPEDAFTTIAEAIKDIPDPMDQTRLAMDAFGERGAKILPAIQAGLADLRKEAHEFGKVLDEDGVKALDEFGKKFDNIYTQAKVGAANAALSIAASFENLPDVIDKAFRGGLGPAGIGAAFGAVGMVERAKEGGRKTDIALPPEVTKAAADYVEQLKKVRAEMNALPEATRRQIVAGNELKQSEENIAKAQKVSVEVVKLYLAEMQKLGEAQKKLAGMSMVSDFQETIAKARQFAKDIDSGRISLVNLGTKQADVNKLLREAEQAMKAVGATGDPLYRRISELANVTTDWSTALPKVKSGLDDVLGIAKAAAATKVPSDTLLGIMFGDLGKVGSTKLGDISGIGLKVDNADKQFSEMFATAKQGAFDLGKQLDELSRGFAQLAQVSPLEGPLADFAELINLMNIGTQMAGGLASAFRAPKRDEFGNVVKKDGQIQYDRFSLDNFTGKNGAEAAVGAYVQTAQFAIAASQGQTAVLRATDTMGRGNRALRGAAAGAAEGGQYGGAWGAAGGAIIGAIIGAARNPAFEDVFHRVAKNFGTAITEETARGIADVAKSKFGKDRAAAEIFSLDKIIGEGGGIKDSNVKQLEARFRDTFSMLETGKFTMEQGREVLEKNFGTFAQHVRDTEGIASKTFQEIIALNKTFGTNSKEIKKFVEEQTSVLGGSVANLAAPLVEKNDEFNRRIREAQNDTVRAQERGDPKEQQKAAEALNAVLAEQRQFAAGSADEIERLGVIALGSFNAAVNAGSDWLTAVEGMGPALDTLIGLQKDLGLESQNAGLNELTRFRDLVTNNESLVLSTQALGETMKALSSIGGINVETLAAMEAQGVQTFDKLTAAGFSEQQALTMMKGHLLGVIEAHEQLGTPIDENTAKLIEMAKKQGLLKDDGKDMSKVLKDGFKDMKDGTDKLVGSIGLMVKALGKDVPASVQDAIDSLEKIPRNIDINARVTYNDPGWTPPSGGGDNGSDNGGGPPTWDGPSARNGGIIDAGTGTLAMLHGKEAIIPLDRLGRGGDGRKDIHVHVMLPNGRELAHTVVPYIPEVLDLQGLSR